MGSKKKKHSSCEVEDFVETHLLQAVCDGICTTMANT